MSFAFRNRKPWSMARVIPFCGVLKHPLLGRWIAGRMTRVSDNPVGSQIDPGRSNHSHGKSQRTKNFGQSQAEFLSQKLDSADPPVHKLIREVRIWMLGKSWHRNHLIRRQFRTTRRNSTTKHSSTSFHTPITLQKVYFRRQGLQCKVCLI